MHRLMIIHEKSRVRFVYKIFSRVNCERYNRLEIKAIQRKIKISNFFSFLLPKIILRIFNFSSILIRIILSFPLIFKFKQIFLRNKINLSIRIILKLLFQTYEISKYNK